MVSDKKKTATEEDLPVWQGTCSAWVARTAQIAEKIGPVFWFSELRAKVRYAPAHRNWWGAIGRVIRHAGYNRGGWRASKTVSRRGGDEWLYVKKMRRIGM